jgi:hypothetical protein
MRSGGEMLSDERLGPEENEPDHGWYLDGSISKVVVRSKAQMDCVFGSVMV